MQNEIALIKLLKNNDRITMLVLICNDNTHDWSVLQFRGVTAYHGADM